MKVAARLEALLEQTELEMTVAQLLAYMRHRRACSGFCSPSSARAASCSSILPVLFGLLPLFFVLFKRSQRSTRAVASSSPTRSR